MTVTFTYEKAKALDCLAFSLTQTITGTMGLSGRLILLSSHWADLPSYKSVKETNHSRIFYQLY